MPTDKLSVTDAQLEQALHWIAANADPAAAARAKRLYLEEFTSSLRARIAWECMEKGDSAAKADMKARGSDAYQKHLLAYEIAVEDDEKFRWKFKRADIVIEVWRSSQANLRAAGKI